MVENNEGVKIWHKMSELIRFDLQLPKNCCGCCVSAIFGLVTDWTRSFKVNIHHFEKKISLSLFIGFHTLICHKPYRNLYLFRWIRGSAKFKQFWNNIYPRIVDLSNDVTKYEKFMRGYSSNLYFKFTNENDR